MKTLKHTAHNAATAIDHVRALSEHRVSDNPKSGEVRRRYLCCRPYRPFQTPPAPAPVIVETYRTRISEKAEA